MRTIPAGLLAEIQAKPSRLARIFTLTPVGGSAFYFTDHDQSIVANGHTYIASSAIQVQAIELSTGDVAANSEITINYVDGLSRHLAVGGAYDNAPLTVDLISWALPSAGILNLLTGTLLQKNTSNQNIGSFTVKGRVREIDGFLVELYGPECRANLGDFRCKLSLISHTAPFVITAVTDDRRIFTATIVGAFTNGDFGLGRLKFDDDALDIEVSASQLIGVNTHLIQLAIPRSGDAIAIAQTGNITRGCDKSLTRCMYFDNVINRRAEDYLPGPDIAIKKATSDF